MRRAFAAHWRRLLIDLPRMMLMITTLRPPSPLRVVVNVALLRGVPVLPPRALTVLPRDLNPPFMTMTMTIGML